MLLTSSSIRYRLSSSWGRSRGTASSLSLPREWLLSALSALWQFTSLAILTLKENPGSLIEWLRSTVLTPCDRHVFPLSLMLRERVVSEEPMSSASQMAFSSSYFFLCSAGRSLYVICSSAISYVGVDVDVEEDVAEE